jgi:hypothetical protein
MFFVPKIQEGIPYKAFIKPELKDEAREVFITDLPILEVVDP